MRGSRRRLPLAEPARFAAHRLAPWWSRGWLQALLSLVTACVLLAPAHAQPETEVTQMQLDRNAEGVFLTAQLRFELPPLVLTALEKGIPMFFVAEATLLRDRWYWTDKRVIENERHQRLAYLPLTRRWRLSVSSEPNDTSGLGLNVGLTQHYDSLPEALAALQRIGRWKIADGQEIEPDARYWVELSFRLDLSQLPRPFQIGAVGQNEWNVAARRGQRLPALQAMPEAAPQAAEPSADASKPLSDTTPK